MVDVARHAGVSLKTVSRVVNNEPAVAHALVGRVLSAIAELGFRRNDIARNLRSGRLNAPVGLLIEEIANPFYATIAAVAADIAADHQTLLMTASSEEDVERERTLLVELCQRRGGGPLGGPAAGGPSCPPPRGGMGGVVAVFHPPAGGMAVGAGLG